VEAEKLKVIAEGMHPQDYISVRIVDDRVHIRSELCGSRNAAEWIYNPLTNNDQMVEIVERLKISIEYQRKDKWLAETQDELAFGKIINEAVCNAAYEYYKAVK